MASSSSAVATQSEGREVERRGIPGASFVKNVEAYLNQLGLDALLAGILFDVYNMLKTLNEKLRPEPTGINKTIKLDDQLYLVEAICTLSQATCPALTERHPHATCSRVTGPPVPLLSERRDLLYPSYR
ncbi:hypothetical protein Tco_1485611 [Tanacetum coccineum]